MQLFKYSQRSKILYHLAVAVLLFLLFRSISLTPGKPLLGTTLVRSIPKRFFIGIFTVADKLERRSLIRMTYQKLRRPSTDIFFILGQPANKYQERLIRFENETYGDILVLPTKENMDNGKTYSFFKYVHESGFQHPYVMKLDDDNYVNITNLENKIDAMNGEPHVYFGRLYQSTGFMVGMGYGLSKRLVEYVATDEYPKKNQEGQEDAVVANWVSHFEKDRDIKVWRKSWYEYYDHPQSGQGWAEDFSDSALLIHRCKEKERFIDAADFFLHDRKVGRGGDA